MTEKKTAQKKAKAAGTITVVQYASVHGAKPGMKETVVGLGLGRIGARRELQDTPAVRGMVRKTRHIVRIEGEKA